MKQLLIITALSLSAAALVSCEKQNPTPIVADQGTNSPHLKTIPAHCLLRSCDGWRIGFEGDYEQVAFYSDLFGVWSYTTTGPIEVVENDSIKGPGWNTPYFVTSVGHIYVGNPYNDEAHVYPGAGDTLVIDFIHENDVLKWIPYP